MKQLMAIGLLIIGASVIFILAQKSSPAPAENDRANAVQTNTTQQPQTITSDQTANQLAPTKASACTLPISQAPDIGGLRLGLNVEQVLALFPGSKEDSELRAALARPASPIGMSSLSINPQKYESKAKFARIKQFTLTFLDGRIATFNAAYDGPKWKDVDEFVTKFSEGTTLPAAEAWEPYVGLDTQLKSLKCDGFEISVFAGGEGGNLNYVQAKDLVADQELRDRRKKAREKAAKEAKP
ncbi:MAG: hypothetical protein M3R69_03215 [Acidobacteriota bacterium]|nr:hypothetical protein [Acidobacteriota bacterium]